MGEKEKPVYRRSLFLAEACPLRLKRAFFWRFGRYKIDYGATFPHTMSSYNSVKTFFCPKNRIVDTVLNSNIDLNFGIGYDEYCKTITLSSDEQIVDHYNNFAPDLAIPIMRKGTDYKVFKRLYDIENTVGELNTLFDNSVYIHISGIFFQEYNNPINRFCFDCMYNNVSNDPTEINAFHQHKMEFNSALAGDLIHNPINHYKYWCTICDCFLFNVLCSDSNMCGECEVFITYDSNTGLPIQFFHDDIDFYFSVESNLFFDD
jgi:hypothetical protein